MSQASHRIRNWSLSATSVLAFSAALVLTPIWSNGASAQALSYASAPTSGFVDDEAMVAPDVMEDGATYVTPERLRRTEVSFATREAPGTIVIDTANTQLYYVLGNGRAMRYGVGVGREGFTWAGTQIVTRKAEWPDWHPPADMIARQPYLPRFMAGGPGNPLGARAMYLGSSVYRIHGTNDASTIGKFVSSGCIRLTNEDVADLFSRVTVGTKVVVLPKSGPAPRFEAVRDVPRAPAVSTRRAEGRQAMNLSAPSIY
jgi:lipoprotein-anchoring transpeptidase ErfK/SrfK